MAQGSIPCLVLTRTHRVLLEDRARLPRAGAPPHLCRSARDELAAQLGVAIPAPVGSRVAAPGAPPTALAFVLEDDVPPAAAARLVSLADALALLATPERDLLRALHGELLLGGHPVPDAPDVFAFGSGAAMATRLAHLVVAGDKRATALWLRGARADGSTVPAPGLVSIVVDGFGMPRCLIRTEEVLVVRFRDVTAELAAEEGEGDRTLEDWRDGHLRYFRGEAAALGLTFDEDEELAIERFRVLHVVGRADRDPG
jgi:uncharacterized protein YhfF